MASSPSKEQISGREDVMKCEQEIQSIKAALRKLGNSENRDDPNSLTVTMIKVDGLPDNAKPHLTLQLSSPVEEGTISELSDPLNSDPPPEGAVATFKGVETSNATLTVTAKDADIPLGSSASYDLAPLCQIDPMDLKEKYESEIPVAILPDSAGEGNMPTEAVEESKDSKEGGAETAAAEAVAIVPICTFVLKVVYKPSAKDQREELYELLNKTSQRKATALENLRKLSMAMTRSGGGSAGNDSPSNTSSSSTTLDKPAVRPGFLNKAKKEPTRMEKLYERTIGPDSILRKGLGIVVIARNYFIFFGAITFFHFKGQMLSLPAPV